MNQRTCWRHQSEYSLQNMDSCGQCLAKVSDCSCNTKRNGCHRNWERWTVLQKYSKVASLRQVHFSHALQEREMRTSVLDLSYMNTMHALHTRNARTCETQTSTAREDGIRQRAQLACHFKKWGNVHQCSCRIWQRIRSPECTTTSVSKHRLAHTLISYSNIAHNHRRTHIHVQRDCTDACTIHRWPFDTVNANVDQLFSKP